MRGVHPDDEILAAQYMSTTKSIGYAPAFIGRAQSITISHDTLYKITYRRPPYIAKQGNDGDAPILDPCSVFLTTSRASTKQQVHTLLLHFQNEKDSISMREYIQ